MLESFLRQNKKILLAGFAAVIVASASGQTIRLPYETGHRLNFDQPIRPGPPQHRANGLRTAPSLGALLQASPVVGGLPFFTAFYDSFGTPLAMNIIGTDPSLRPATTHIPTVIVPVELVFDNGTDLDPTNEVNLAVSSALFQNALFSSGATVIGETQYGDAIQRAQFWNLGGADPNYHVLLDAPTVLPVRTIHVPSGSGFGGVTSGGVQGGLVDGNFLSPIIEDFALTSGFGPDTLPIFITHNVLQYQGDLSNCCTLGYHNSTSGPIATAQTWVYATYSDPEILGSPNFADTAALSHEIAEWLNDPFVGAFPGINLIPPVSFQGGCLINFETGDSLEDLPNPSFVVDGFHMQDEAYLFWFLHTQPSPAANGYYTFVDNFTTPAGLCGPG